VKPADGVRLPLRDKGWPGSAKAGAVVGRATAPISMGPHGTMENAMLCPIDGTQLVMTERSGVEIDYCPQCRGVWLDRGELDKIIERSAGHAAPPPPPAAPVARDSYRAPAGDDRRRKGRMGGFLDDLFDF
jgi:Zn-finger nucleic acid-binding protein